MKRPLVLIAFLLSAYMCTAQQSLILDNVVAKIGSQYILYSEVQELFSYAKQQNPDYSDDLQCIIMEQLMSKKILLDQAKLDSIEVADVEIEVELERRIAYILQTMGGSEEQFIEIYGKTPAEQKETMREPLRDQIIEQRIQGQILASVEITPEEVVAFFDQIPTDSLPYFNSEVEIGEIVVKTMISVEIKEKALNKLSTLREQIVAGEASFEELASIHSDDPGSGKAGGDLGWAKRGSYVPEFEAAAYSLGQDEISEVIETKFGYHLMQLIGRRGNNVHVRHILIRPETTEADITRTKAFLDSIGNQITIDSMSFDLAVKLYSDKDQQSYNNAGRMLNNETGDTFWETSQLPYQVYFAVDELEVNEMSEVLEFEERGDKIFKVVQLQSKTRPHRASLSSDYAKITEFAKESKKNEYFNTWMEEKISNTFIDISASFKSCPNLDKYLLNSVVGQ